MENSDDKVLSSYYQSKSLKSKNMLLNNQWVNKKIREEIKK